MRTQVNASRRSFTGWPENLADAVRQGWGTAPSWGTKAKPLAVGTTLAALLFKRPPALIPAVPAVPIMMVVVGVICVEMSVVWVITVVMMVVRMMIIAVPPSCGWSRAADCDCADNA